MQIRIYETVSQRPNGDRDIYKHPSSSFEVILVNGDSRCTVFENNQFDNFNCHISGSRASYLQQAMDKAIELAKALGTVEIVGVESTKHEKEIMDLEKSIKHDQAKLAELKRRYL